MLIKKYGARFNKGLKIINLRDILLLSFFAFIVFAQAFGALDAELGTRWKSTRTLFSVHSSLAKMDKSLRVGLQCYAEKYALLLLLVYSELFSIQIGPVQTALRLADSKFIYNSTMTIHQSPDMIRYMAKYINNTIIMLTDSIRLFRNNELLKDLPENLRDKVLKERLVYTIYNGTKSQVFSKQRISAVSFMGVFRSGLVYLLSNYVAILPLMNSKVPPLGLFRFIFALDLEAIIGPHFSIMRNSWDGSLENHNSTLHIVRDLMVSGENTSLFRNSYIYMSVTLFLVLLCLVLMLSMSFRIRAKLSSILAQYNNLRRDEIAIQQVAAQQKLAFYDQFKLHEARLMVNYTKTAYNFVVVNSAGAIPAKKESAKNRVTPPKIQKRSVAFGSIFGHSCMMLLLIVILTYYLVMVFNNLSSYGSLFKMISLYTGAVQATTNAYNYHMAVSMHLMFGDFVPISRMPASKYVAAKIGDSKPLHELISYLIDNRNLFSTLFNQQKDRQIESLVFSDSCNYLNKSRVFFKEEQSLCLSTTYASKGLLSFFYKLLDYYADIQAKLKQDTTFIPLTENTWASFPLRTYCYEHERYTMSVLSNVFYESLIETIMSAGDATIQASFDQLYFNLIYLNRLVPALMFYAFVVIYLLTMITSIRKDMQVCSETLFNMLPEIIVQNKLILRIFDETYSLKY